MASPSRVLRVLPALFAPVVGACSAPVVDDIADASGGMTQAVVLVERVERIDAADLATQTNVSAKFMRVMPAAEPEIAERVVGSPLDLPPDGECVPLPAVAGGDESALAAIGSIDLLDVGDVAIRANGSAMWLAARAFPDVGDLVSGVFYTSRDAAMELPAPARYVVEASGSAHVDRFAIEADAPPPPDEVRIGDAPLGDGLRIGSGEPVPLRWRALGGAGRRDLVYVDVASTETGTAVRCAFSDDGEGAIPGAFLRPEALGAAADAPVSATIAVHRVRRDDFVGSGIDFGEIRFDVSVVARAAIERAVGAESAEGADPGAQ